MRQFVSHKAYEGEFKEVLLKSEINLQGVTSRHIALLTQSKIPGILGTAMIVENGERVLHYQTKGKMIAEEFFSRHTLTAEQLHELLSNLLETVEGLDRYFLNPKGLHMTLEHLYLDPHRNQPYFVYNPKQAIDAESVGVDSESIIQLMRSIVLEKVRLEMSDGLIDLLKLINVLRTSDKIQQETALRSWISQPDQEHEKPFSSPVATREWQHEEAHLFQNDKFYMELQTEAAGKSYLNTSLERKAPLSTSPNSASTAVPIQKISKRKELKMGSTLDFKSVGMISVMVAVLLLSGISFYRPIGWIEALGAAGIGFVATVLIGKKMTGAQKILPEKGEAVADQAEELEGEVFSNQLQSISGSSSLNVIPMTRNLGDPGENNFTRTQTGSRHMEDSKTVMLEPPLRMPELKALNTGVGDIVLDRDLLRIGRCPTSSDVALASNTVGRIHAEIQRTDGGLLLRDCTTLNGTFVNGIRLGDAPVALQNMDLIKFSCFEFRLVMP